MGGRVPCSPLGNTSVFGDRTLSICEKCVPRVEQEINERFQVTRFKLEQERQKLLMAERKIQVDIDRHKTDAWIKLLGLMKNEDSGVLELLMNMAKLRRTQKMINNLEQHR